jgi:hypothetical protein
MVRTRWVLGRIAIGSVLLAVLLGVFAAQPADVLAGSDTSPGRAGACGSGEHVKDVILTKGGVR